MNSSAAVVVAVLVLLVVVVAVVLALRLRSRRHADERREQAGELRGEAAVGVAGVQAQQDRAADLEREAVRAREKADLLESRAQEQRLNADRSAAELEHAVREADRVDPDVDHRADGYAPDLDSPRAHSEAAAAADRELGQQAGGQGVGSAVAEPVVPPRPTDPDDPDFRART